VDEVFGTHKRECFSRDIERGLGLAEFAGQFLVTGLEPGGLGLELLDLSPQSGQFLGVGVLFGLPVVAAKVPFSTCLRQCSIWEWYSRSERSSAPRSGLPSGRASKAARIRAL
jgi:hypothetical protein